VFSFLPIIENIKIYFKSKVIKFLLAFIDFDHIF